MKKEVKDLYLCLLCPEGYIRGLREYYPKSSRASSSYAEAMFNRIEADKMNKFVNHNITIRGIKNQAVLIIDLDVCSGRYRRELTELIAKINRLYDIKILGISQFDLKDLEEQFSYGYKGLFFKQIVSQNDSFSVKYIISSSNYYTYVYVGNPHIIAAAEERDVTMCIPVYDANNMLYLLRSEYLVE